MSYREVEKAREIRLWIGQIIVPAVTGSIILLSIPEVRYWVGDKVKKIRQKHEAKKAKIIILDRESE